MKLPKENLFFTSDTHFYHKNIIKHCNRPFDNLYYMHKALIEVWNNKVPPEATVFHLGDFAYKSNIEMIKELIGSLNGSIHLILGNHDYQNNFNRPSILGLFESTHDHLYIDVEESKKVSQGIFLCHYPMLSWAHSQQKSWQLFGHIHSGPENTAIDKNLPLKPTQYDVGVDNNRYQPISYDEVKTIITKQLNK